MQQPRKHLAIRPKTRTSNNRKWFLIFFGGFFALAGFSAILSIILGVKWVGDNGTETTWPVIILGIVFIVVGLGIAFFSRKSVNANVDYSTLPVWDASEAPSGKQELKPQMGGAKGMFSFTVAFAFIWNAIVWFFVINEQEISWFLWLFVAIGILAVGAMVWYGLAMLNPKVVITLHNVPLTLGKRFTVNWEIDGNVERLDGLSVSLIGQEQATYERGTDTYTDTNDFYQCSENIALSNLRMGRGELGFEIPENTMHTWHSSNNKIVWLLKINGNIPRWPNIKENYEITVFAKHSV